MSTKISSKDAVSKERPAKKARVNVKFKKATKKRSISSPPPQSVASKRSSETKGKQRQHTETSAPPKNTAKQEGELADKPRAAPPSTFKVIAGSYEKLLYGLEGTTTSSSSSELEWSLKPIFIFPAHVSSVKAVAASPDGGKWLATGSSDEIIKVWDLRRRREVGGLMHHEGSITHLNFPSRSHLLSASEDGTLCLFRARDWAVLRTLKGHKGRVNSVAVHPSGKVALSVGKDRTLRMWDLMRGRGSASTKLGVEGELVRWSTSGSLLAVQYQKTIDLYSNDLSRIHTINHPSRIHDVKFVARHDADSEVLLVAAEDKKVTVYSTSADRTESPKIIANYVGHENRVKAMDTLRVATPLKTRSTTTILSTVSSDGMLHIYDLSSLPSPSDDQKETPQIQPAALYDSKQTRFTCITLADGDPGEIAGSKRKREDEQGAKEEPEDGEDEEWASEQELEEDAEEEEDEDEDEDEEEDE